MRAAERLIKVRSRSDRFYLHILSDLHIGSAQCDEAAIERALKDGGGKPNHLFIVCGDVIDCIGHKDPRYTPSKLHKRFVGVDDILGLEIERAAELFRKHLEPGQLLGILDGNHERKSLDYCSFHPTRRIVEMINGYTTGIPQCHYLGYHCLFRLSFRRSSTTNSFMIHAHHGIGTGRTIAAPMNSIYRHAVQYRGDVHCYGHAHNPIYKPFVQEYFMSKQSLKVKERQSWIISAGAFQRTLSGPDEAESYAEIKGYPAHPNCGVVLEMVNDWDNGECYATLPRVG